MTSNEHTSGFKFIATNGIETGEDMEIIHRDITINSKKQNVFIIEFTLFLGIFQLFGVSKPLCIEQERKKKKKKKNSTSL